MSRAKIRPIAISRKWWKIGSKLLLFTHRKWNVSFPFVPKLVTLNDLERRKWPLFCVISLKSGYLGPITSVDP